MAEEQGKSATDRFPYYVALGISLALWLVNALNGFALLDKKWTDQMLRWRGMERGDSRVTVIAIDDASIKQIGQFPWPRSVYARLFRKLDQLGVQVAAVDVLFMDRSTPSEDAALIEATAGARMKIIHAVGEDTNILDRHVFVHPFAALRKASRHFGGVSQWLLDPDGAVRWTFLMYGEDKSDPSKWLSDPNRVPSLGLKAVALLEGRSPDEYVRERNALYMNLRGEALKIVGKTTRDGVSEDLVLPDYGIARIPAWKILYNQLDEAQRKALKGGIALIGSTALGAYDHYPSAFSEMTPGVEVHANVIDNLLNDRELRWHSRRWTALAILAFSLLAAWVLNLGPMAATGIVLAVLAAWVGFDYKLFRGLRVLEFTAPTLSLAGTFAVLIIRKTLLENREKRFIKHTFGQFVAPEVVDDLVKDPAKVKLGGEKRDMTVLFLDIAHFTTISERMTPEALIQFLNKYLSALSEVIHVHKGVVDKYIGDCIMAFWNAPLEQKDHRTQACVAAVECMEALRELNKTLDPALPERPAIRIGLNSGEMTVGLTGSKQKLQYTVIGDEVNLASRLEGANKFFGSDIMVSESCFNGAKASVEGRVLGEVRVVGKSIPIRVYELLGKRGQLSPQWQKALPLYEKGLELFLKGDFAGSHAAFGDVLKVIPEDKPSKLYYNRSHDYANIPPVDDDWRVFNLTAK